VRTLGLVSAFAAGCAATAPPPSPAPPTPLDEAWTRSIRAGDLIAIVPGTGATDYLATPIEALPGDVPLVDVRAIPKVASDAGVLEAAVAAAHRAGLSDADLESGAITIGLWGAGFTRISAFDYLSYDGIRVRVAVLGGKNTCAEGLVDENLLNYSVSNATIDATDLYARVRAWLAANPSATGMPRNVTVVAHSWGGAVAELLAYHSDAAAAAVGPLADAGGTAQLPFTIAAGVPGFVPGYLFAGPGVYFVDATEQRTLYEIDRPDDPVHAMNPSGNGDGHQYDIVVGDDFLGFYGVSTEQLACAGVAGECH